jgi:hypothetical protein
MKQLVLATSLAATISLAADGLHARIQVISVGDEPYSRQASLEISHWLGEIDGVTMVAKEPDYYVMTHVRRIRDQVVISVTVEEALEGRLAERVLFRNAYKGEVEGGSFFFEVMRRADHIELMSGSLWEVPKMSAEIVAGINEST